ncbi:MAG: hypothetical protein ACP5G7_02970 [Anaerolineae bacterium]
MPNNDITLCNKAYELRVCTTLDGMEVHLHDRKMALCLADAPYLYRATRTHSKGLLVAIGLQEASLVQDGDTLVVAGTLAGLELRHTLRLPADTPVLEEGLELENATDELIRLEGFVAGFQRRVATGYGAVLPEVASDRFAALPLKHRATDPAGFDADFTLDDLLRQPGLEQRATDRPKTFAFGNAPATQWASEGWAWTHGKHALAISTFNQEVIQFGTLALEAYPDHLTLRFGGLSMVDGEPSALGRLAPGQRLTLGLTRFETVEGGYEEAAYAFRAFLDAQGCRFPDDYNPAVHWNELYDNPEWNLAQPQRTPSRRMTRPEAYTKALLEEEAAKAAAYGCQALYLDPGWDTDFGTLLWGESWLGPRDAFVREMRERYGLKVSLHCPLATWMSMDGRGVSSWPREAFQMDAHGEIVEGAVCLGSQQYLDAAAERLLAHCADGVAFLMFDGNWWNGGCWHPHHGHPVPYTKEDHARANLELARRIHEKYPDVLIEMHDTISGGSLQRYTPVYYKYGLPGSYDDNWGFELMWRPMEDLRSGRARSLYYYNLGCNVPAYLHIDLRDDNSHCVVLWWYASTCRHLGIGGTHPDPMVAQAQRLAMAKYRSLERYYKRGAFYGMDEEIHVHVLADEQSLVVNLFNLSDEERVVEGSLSFARMGLDPGRWYDMKKGLSINHASEELVVRRRLPAWGAEVWEVRSYGDEA